jgi:multidrug efflux pump subunit AcrA (membrane-fusion protein)
VTQAELSLTQAQDRLAEATLTAPMAGTVAAIGLTTGSAAGSSGITITGTGGATVTAQVPVATVSKVKVGQPVQVTPPGALEPVEGTVEQIGLLPSSSTSASGSSTTTYPVTISVPEPTATLAPGSRAGASILVGTANRAVTVPNSAVTRLTGTAAFVTLVSGDTTTRTPVTLGLVGPTRTQVLSGLRAGQTVLLADASLAVPTSNSQTPFARFAGGGGFGGGGGGFGGNGFGGGGGAVIQRAPR